MKNGKEETYRRARQEYIKAYYETVIDPESDIVSCKDRVAFVADALSFKDVSKELFSYGGQDGLQWVLRDIEDRLEAISEVLLNRDDERRNLKEVGAA